jgi:hypothetical protein
MLRIERTHNVRGVRGSHSRYLVNFVKSQWIARYASILSLKVYAFSSSTGGLPLPFQVSMRRSRVPRSHKIPYSPLGAVVRARLPETHVDGLEPSPTYFLDGISSSSRVRLANRRMSHG